MIAGLRGLFVTGTDTGVGKTRVAAEIARSLARSGHRVGVLKPLATGLTRAGETLQCGDAEALIAAIGGGVPWERVTPLAFEAPLAPPVAARAEGRTLDHPTVLDRTSDALAWWRERADVIVAEGVGGLLCPLAEGTTVADLAVELDFPLVIVARRGLGTLNHTLLTVEAARRRGLRLAGIVLNSPEPGAEGLAERTNTEELARRLEGTAILAESGHDANGALLSKSIHAVNWDDWAAAPRLVRS